MNVSLAHDLIGVKCLYKGMDPLAIVEKFLWNSRSTESWMGLFGNSPSPIESGIQCLA